MGPIIETERLLLRPPRQEDLDGWSELMREEDGSRFIGGPLSRAETWRIMAAIAGSWSLRGFGMFSVLERATGDWIGRLGPWQPEGWPGTEVAYGLVKRAWGKGYALEGATAAIDWAFQELGWTEVIHTIDPANKPSQLLARRLGAHNAGPGRLPPPFEAWRIDIWRQSREEWFARGGERRA